MKCQSKLIREIGFSGPAEIFQQGTMETFFIRISRLLQTYHKYIIIILLKRAVNVRRGQGRGGQIMEERDGKERELKEWRALG